MVCKHSRCRNLDHDTNLNVICNCNTFSKKVCFFFIKNCFRCTEFFQERNHWEHDTQLTVNRRTKKSTDLCAEHSISSLRDRDTKSTESKEWVHFVRHIEVRKFLISTDIHCTNDNRFTVHSFKNSLVCFILLIFSWEVLRIHVQELCTVKSNSFCTVVVNTFNVFWSTDISSQLEVFTVSSHCLSIFQERPFSFLFRISFTSCFKFCRLFISWVDNNLTSDPVNSKDVTVFNDFSDVVCT
ncbi:Uncharacterised protein [Streptococcus pneumoniae]|nr:Uncharacterised protein [Streptococcus pneumoniae]